MLDRTRVSDVQGSRIATNSTSISCERNQEQRGTFESFHWIFERLRSGRSALVGLSAGQFGICPCLQLTSTTASACGLWAQLGIQGAHGNLGGVLEQPNSGGPRALRRAGLRLRVGAAPLEGRRPPCSRCASGGPGGQRGVKKAAGAPCALLCLTLRGWAGAASPWSAALAALSSVIRSGPWLM